MAKICLAICDISSRAQNTHFLWQNFFRLQVDMSQNRVHTNTSVGYTRTCKMCINGNRRILLQIAMNMDNVDNGSLWAMRQQPWRRRHRQTQNVQFVSFLCYWQIADAPGIANKFHFPSEWTQFKIRECEEREKKNTSGTTHLKHKKTLSVIVALLFFFLNSIFSLVDFIFSSLGILHVDCPFIDLF